MAGNTKAQRAKLDGVFLHRQVYQRSRFSPYDDDGRVINDKIRSVFTILNDTFPLKGIIFQFWAPIRTTSRRLVLSTVVQPYAFAQLSRRLGGYRNCSFKCYYGIDDNEVKLEECEREDHKEIISCGPPAAAFLKGFPEVVLDLRRLIGPGNPLVPYALKADLTCSVMLPVFYQTSCVGVVECSMKKPSLLVVFNELKRALKSVGMSISHVQGSWPYKTITSNIGLKPATTEIEKALEIVCESQNLTLGQVWIPSESDSHCVPCSSSSMQTKRMILVKLMGYCVDSNDDSLSSFKDFYNNCDVLPLKMGEGLAGKTLQTYQPHFCSNIYKLSDNGGGVFELLYANSECSSCVVICLRSAHTGDLDYAFEFFWPQSRNHLILLEALILTLKMCLPSFHFPSGAQLGDELHVVHVENSSFKILKGNELSQKTKASKETKVKFGDLYNYLYESQSHLNQVKQELLTDINNKTNLDDDDVDDDDDDVAIVALYKGNATLFFLSSPSTLAQAKGKMCEDFHLDPAGNYKLECEAKEGQWLNLDSDERLECFISYRRRIKKNHVKMRVHVLDK